MRDDSERLDATAEAASRPVHTPRICVVEGRGNSSGNSSKYLWKYICQLEYILIDGMSPYPIKCVSCARHVRVLSIAMLGCSAVWYLSTSSATLEKAGKPLRAVAGRTDISSWSAT
jgi:hypothetical protein